MTNMFNIPIVFSKNLKNTDETLVNDLELVSAKTDMDSVYTHLFTPKTKYGKDTIHSIAKYYTTDKNYLKETQKIYNLYKPVLNESIIKKFNDSIDAIKQNVNFLKDYQFLDIKQLHFLNENEMFLQLFSVYNMASPAVSLLYPIILFIIPFFLLKLKFKDLPLDTYKNLLYKQLSESSFAKLRFVVNDEVDAFKKLYICVTVGLYIYGIYQNINSCIKFISNIKVIKQTFDNCKEYFNYILTECKLLKTSCKSIKAYEPFVKTFESHIENIESMNKNMSNLTITLKNPTSIGSSLLILHTLRFNKTLNETFEFMNGFVGYIDTYLGLTNHIKDKDIHKVEYTNKTSKFKNICHPLVKSEKKIYNNINLDKNIILSGPNASGKTTLIKGLCINILLSQQVGYGYFKVGKLHPYDNINSYLNIGDNNDRDSLFQAEARRCKLILDEMKLNKDERHFCVFDELYSGTNPQDAVKAGTMYLKYISKLNCKFVITTHYKELCNKMEDNKFFTNKQMEEYKLKDGISNNTNGITILQDLNYPKELLDLDVV